MVSNNSLRSSKRSSNNGNGFSDEEERFTDCFSNADEIVGTSLNNSGGGGGGGMIVGGNNGGIQMTDRSPASLKPVRK